MSKLADMKKQYLSKEEWQEKYRQERLDPRWQKKRLEVLEYAQWRCQGCGSKNDRTLHVHHSYYPPRGKACWQVPTCALIALCDVCHAKLHPEKRAKEPAKESTWEDILRAAGVLNHPAGKDALGAKMIPVDPGDSFYIVTFPPGMNHAMVLCDSARGAIESELRRIYGNRMCLRMDVENPNQPKPTFKSIFEMLGKL